jgi:hypothetical protein
VYRPGARIIPWIAFAAMVLALGWNLFPVQAGPYGRMPYIYLAYLIAGLVWFLIHGRMKNKALSEN